LAACQLTPARNCGFQMTTEQVGGRRPQYKYCRPLCSGARRHSAPERRLTPRKVSQRFTICGRDPKVTSTAGRPCGHPAWPLLLAVAGLQPPCLPCRERHGPSDVCLAHNAKQTAEGQAFPPLPPKRGRSPVMHTALRRRTPQLAPCGDAGLADDSRGAASALPTGPPQGRASSS